MRGYGAVARGVFQTGVVYRFGFIFTILSNMIYMGVVYYLWRSIYQGRETLRGLTFNETFLYVALGSAVFILLKTYTDWYIAYDIREGTIVHLLIKPVDYQLYQMFFSFGYILINLAGITAPTLLMLFGVFRVDVALGIGLLLFPLSLLLAFLVSFALDYFVGLLAFYTESGWGLSMTKEIIISVLSGALIPLQFFPDAMQTVLNWLPFRAIFHIPLMMVTRPAEPLENYLSMLAVQIFWVVVLFLGTRLFYRQAIKVLRIGGG